jgi:hypothetical protein
MTSFKSKQAVERGFMPTFRIQRQVYHLTESYHIDPIIMNFHKFILSQNQIIPVRSRSGSLVIR